MTDELIRIYSMCYTTVFPVMFLLSGVYIFCTFYFILFFLNKVLSHKSKKQSYKTCNDESVTTHFHKYTTDFKLIQCYLHSLKWYVPLTNLVKVETYFCKAKAFICKKKSHNDKQDKLNLAFEAICMNPLIIIFSQV